MKTSILLWILILACAYIPPVSGQTREDNSKIVSPDSTHDAKTVVRQADELLRRQNAAALKNTLGNRFWEKKDYTQALALYEMAIELNPERHVYLANTAYAHQRLGHQEQAAFWFKKAVEKRWQCKLRVKGWSKNNLVISSV